MTATTTASVASAAATAGTRRRPGLFAPLRWEVRKLRAQYCAKAVLIGAVVLPIIVVVVIHGQSRPPKDTASPVTLPVQVP